MTDRLRLDGRTWPEVRRVLQQPPVALLPVGSTEAHGPHLPLATDVILAEGMAAALAEKLAARGVRGEILPSLHYGVTDCAAEFPGTISISAAALRSLLEDIARSLELQGFRALCLVNAHLEPAHRAVLADLAARSPGRVIFPDKVRRRFAERLGPEFLSGACHAGSYETSLMLWLRPDLVREEIRRALPPNPISLGQALKEGKRTFGEAGGPQAYFGFPAEASAEEGRRLLEVLASLMADEVASALPPAPDPSSGP